MSCASAKFGRSTGCLFAEEGFDDAGFEKPVRRCISPAVALQRFDEDDGGDDRRPETAVTKGANERECPW